MTPNSNSPAWSTAPALCSTRSNLTATRTPSSTSNTPARPKLPGGLTITRARSSRPADAEHFEQDQSNRKFYDPDFKSCTSFIAMIAQQRFGFDPTPVADLVHWTDIIDGALYPDAKTAVEMKDPAMKLTMVIESAPDHGFVPNLIPLLATKSLAEILEEPFVAPLLPPLLKRHELSIGHSRRSAPNAKTAQFSSTSPIRISRATTNSFRTTCIPNRSTASGSARAVFA